MQHAYLDRSKVAQLKALSEEESTSRQAESMCRIKSTPNVFVITPRTESHSASRRCYRVCLHQVQSKQ